MGRSKRCNGDDRMERVMDDTGEQANNVMEQAWIGWSKHGLDGASNGWDRARRWSNWQ